MAQSKNTNTNTNKQTDATNMEFVTIPRTSLKVSRIGLGTWAIGGWMWGGTDDAQSIAPSRWPSIRA
jgi:hypothetical protein